MKKSLSSFLFILFYWSALAQNEPKSGLDMINYVVNQLDKKIIIDKSNSNEIASLYKLKADSNFVEIKNTFKDYYVGGSYLFLNDSLLSASFDSFYDSLITIEKIKNDADAIHLLLSKNYGLPSDSYDQTATWNIKHYSIDFTIYDNGWGLYIRSLNREYPSYDSTGNCAGIVGDFFTLNEDLTSVLLDNLKSEDIAIGYTSRDEMAAIYGDSIIYNKEYEGIRLSAYFTYKGDKLSSIRYDYFYVCEGAKVLLSQDKYDIKTKIESVLGTATVSGSGDFQTYDWTFKGYKITQTNFGDGYALSINK
jgi:hypothetical protein